MKKNHVTQILCYRGLLSKALAVAIAFGAAWSSHAQDIISFDVMSGPLTGTGVGANQGRNTMFPNEFAGAPGVRTNNWNLIGNYLNGGTGNADATLVDGTITNASGNMVPGMAATIHWNGQGSGGGFLDRNAGGTNDGKMIEDVIDTAGNGGANGFSYISFTNIPFSAYDIYCYNHTDNGNGPANTRGGFFVISNTPSGNQHLYIKNQDANGIQLPRPNGTNFSTSYVQSTTASIPPGGTSWANVQGGNYCVFSGLTNSSCQIFFAALGNTGTGGNNGGTDDLGDFINDGSTVVRIKVSGFQIVQFDNSTATNLYLQNPDLTLHAGDPAAKPLVVLVDTITPKIGLDVTKRATVFVDNTNVVNLNAARQLIGVTNGTANLIVNYQSLSLTNPINVIGPVSLRINVLNTNLLVGNGQGDTTTAQLLANFSDATNVVVNAFKFVSFSTVSGGIISINPSNGTATATGVGSFSVTGNYNGLSVTTNSAGTVTAWPAVGGLPVFGVKLEDAGHRMLFHDLSGNPGVRVGYWNNMVQTTFGNVTNQLGNLVDYNGNPVSGALVQFLPNNPAQQAMSTPNAVTNNESVMFGTFFDQGMNNGTTLTSRIVVSNVPYSTYDVYFYVVNDPTSTGTGAATNRVGEFIVNGVTKYRNNDPNAPSGPDNNGNGYVRAVPQPASLPASIVDVPFGNVVRFTGLTGSILTADFAGVGQDFIGDANTVTRVRLAGFQVAKSVVGLTATNIYLAFPVPGPLPGSPTNVPVTVLANFSDGTVGGDISDLPGITYGSTDAGIFTVDTNGVLTAGPNLGTANLIVSYQGVSLTNLVTTLPTPPNLAVGVAGDALTLSWPTQYLGWTLQEQTNSIAIGLQTNWVDVSGSQNLTSTNITINRSNGAVLYRLKYP
jgi:hypothetical protein